MSVKPYIPLVSVTCPCFNEEHNIHNLYARLDDAFAKKPQYRYEIVFADNASTDGTPSLLRSIAARDPRVKVIFNQRNFGIARSSLNVLLSARGDLVVPVAADLQDPPELLPKLIERWEEGFKIVAAVKRSTSEHLVMRVARRAYYRFLGRISETELLNDFTGFGLYDRSVVDLVRATGDHYPYFRGLVLEMGFPIARVEYDRPARSLGTSKNAFYQLYAEAWLGLTSHSKVPLRAASFIGFVIAFLSLIAAAGYFAYKITHWDEFSVGVAPLIIGTFFVGAVQCIFLGILGEYIGAIHSRIFQRWLVIEKERLNFEKVTSQTVADVDSDPQTAPLG